MYQPEVYLFLKQKTLLFLSLQILITKTMFINSDVEPIVIFLSMAQEI